MTVAQSWNDLSLPWQNEKLPYKSVNQPWNNPGLPWRAAPGTHPYSNMLLRNASDKLLRRAGTDTVLIGHP